MELLNNLLTRAPLQERRGSRDVLGESMMPSKSLSRSAGICTPTTRANVGAARLVACSQRRADVLGYP